MNVSAFIRSYAKDREWLSLCLRAVEKHGKQFSEVIVAIPETDEIHFREFDFRDAMHTLVPVLAPNPYIDQQICKVHADEYCKGDFIMHFDSDCIATKEINLPDFFIQDSWDIEWDKVLPKLAFRKWEDAGTAETWRLVTRGVLKQEPPFETMPCHPFVYHRSTHELFRRHVADLHGGDFIKYASRLAHFSEFNAIGNFALLYTPDAYRFVRATGEGDGYPRPFRQFWSHSPDELRQAQELLK